MKVIIINSGGGLVSEMIAKFDGMQHKVVVVGEMPKANPFAPEPLLITNDRIDFNPIPYFEVEPSKFISKPKNNFKKR